MKYTKTITKFIKIISLLCFATIITKTASAEVRTDRQYDDVRKFVTDLATKYPQTVSKITIGMNDNDLPIEGITIGHGPVKNMLVSTHHGNEYGSTEVALAFAEDMAINPLPDQTLVVIPVLNISGYNARDRYELNNDPNRDYPGPCGTEGPFHLKSTKALADFIDKENIVASATLHTFYPAVVYPWGISSGDLSTPYDNLFIGLAKAATAFSNYAVGNSTEVIYPADGTYEDYAFWKHGIWSLLFELGESHYPSLDDLTQMVKVNVPGMRQMFMQAPHQRAPDHDFHGKCSSRMRKLDRHDE